MRGRSVVTLLGALLFVVPACEDEAIAPGVETFVANLSPRNEVPDTITANSSGTTSFALLGNVLSWKVDVANIDSVTAGHIHAGEAGVAGGVMVPFNVTATGQGFTGTIAEGSATVVDSVITRLHNGTAYVNIHTRKHPGGEIRGQVVRP